MAVIHVSVAMKFLYILLLSIIIAAPFCLGRGTRFVSCGSVLKLMNKALKVRLHSHDLKYATGSGQQSVTGMSEQEDVNSHWIIKAENGKMCTRGDPIKCGSIIRLEHLETKKNLHSHNFFSPVTQKQEISAYGESGIGDSGDNWKLLCDSEFWERNSAVSLQHVDTGRYLAVSGGTYGRPISGQAEVVGESALSSQGQWIAMEGLFIHKSDFDTKSVGHDPSEL